MWSVTKTVLILSYCDSSLGIGNWYIYNAICSVNETKQLAAVLAHPQFQSNPFAAIQQHLIATLPPTPAPLSKPAPKGGQKKRPNSKKA